MKKIIILMAIFSVLALPVLAATPANFGGNDTAWENNNENAAMIAGDSGSLVNPVSATNIQVVKKTFLSSEFGETKGQPSSPHGKNKDKDEGVATGKLGTEATGDKYAIIIGICDYPGGEYDLCDSDGDSLHMYKALTTLYGYDSAKIHLFKDMGNITYFEEDLDDEIPSITSKAPTYGNISQAITDIKSDEDFTSDDEVVFFFSGHGGWLRDSDDNPIDADPYDEDDGKDELILVHNDDSTGVVGMLDDALVTLFTNFGAARIVFIFDTCLAGGMNDLADNGTSDNGRIVVMATDETHSAYVYSETGEDVDGDGIGDGEGVFTRLFVNKGMLQGLADIHDYTEINGDESATIEESFDYAKKNIPGRLKRLQKPVISDNFNDDLLL